MLYPLSSYPALLLEYFDMVERESEVLGVDKIEYSISKECSLLLASVNER